MNTEVLKMLAQSGGSISGLLKQVWPWLESGLHQLFEYHGQKTGENEFLVFTLTQKEEDQTYYILPGALHKKTGQFRNITVNVQGERKQLIKIDADTVAMLIQNANKMGDPPAEEGEPVNETQDDEPFKELDL